MLWKMCITIGALLVVTDYGFASDLNEGANLAREQCARCHDISADGAPKTMPPSFASIADFRSDDQIFFRIMFPQMHSPMPAWAMMLSNEDVVALTTFIRSLETSEK